ncbi:MAG TPA: response regulator [Candidatus Saccharimonadales bacterium]|nr:response regulator [Candidatus Saccharimonadales bacterium]
MAKVYVVDDDTGLRTAYSAALSKLGHEVETASDGLEGQKLLAKGAPDLLLLDMLMPNLDGIGLLREIRSDDKNKDLKVVVVSNFESMPEASELGVLKYISKLQHNPEDVASQVDKLIKGD